MAMVPLCPQAAIDNLMPDSTVYSTVLSKLDTLLRELVARGERRVPTVAAIAQQFGCSPTVALRAVRHFASNGVLSASRGAGIWLTVDSIPNTLTRRAERRPIRQSSRWVRLADRLRNDIYERRLGVGGQLPSHKELASAYGVSHRTLRRALDALLADGTLEEWGRSCRIPAPASGARRGTRIVLVMRGDSFGDPELFSPRSHAHLRTLENECVRAGVRMQIATCHYIGRELVGIDRVGSLLSSTAAGDILGFVVWTMGLYQAFVDQIVQLVQAARKPLAVFDEDRGMCLPSGPGAELSRVFQMAIDTEPGRLMGEYLLRLGHRRVAFITKDPETAHAAARLAGIREAFEDAGITGGVTVLSAADFPVPRKSYQSPDDFLGLLERILPGYAGMPQEAFPLRERIPVWFASQLAMAPALQQDRDQLFRMLDECAPHDTHTALVGGSDDVALNCFDYLRDKDIAVPDHVSLAGFDDGFNAFLHRLTTYNFNGAAYMRAQLNHVLNPLGGGRALEQFRPAIIRGYVVERWTTAPPRRGTV